MFCTWSYASQNWVVDRGTGPRLPLSTTQFYEAYDHGFVPAQKMYLRPCVLCLQACLMVVPCISLVDSIGGDLNWGISHSHSHICHALLEMWPERWLSTPSLNIFSHACTNRYHYSCIYLMMDNTSYYIRKLVRNCFFNISEDPLSL